MSFIERMIKKTATAIFRPGVQAGVKIGTNSKISPKASIGKNAEIGAFTKVYPAVTIGQDAQIGSNSSVLEGAKVGDGAKTEWRSVIGKGAVVSDRCEIGAESVIADGEIVPEGTVIPDGALFRDGVVHEGYTANVKYDVDTFKVTVTHSTGEYELMRKTGESTHEMRARAEREVQNFHLGRETELTSTRLENDEVELAAS